MPPAHRDPQEPQARLLRPDDLLVAHLTAPGCVLADTDAGPVLVAGVDACLILHLPPQHIGEKAWPEASAPGQSTSGHRAAEASRLVFALDDGTSLPFTLDGVLAILPTLRLLVAAHAVPAGRRGTGPARAQDPTIAQPEPRLLAGSEDLPRFLQATRLARGLVRQVGPPAPPALRGTPPIGPAPARPPLRRRGPRPPTEREASIEAPYRVQVSPSPLGAFVHEVDPVRAPSDPTRTELWRTRLSVRVEDAEGRFVAVDDADEAERIVRAVWSRDLDTIDAGASSDPSVLHPQSLRPRHRRALVRQTSDLRLPILPRPIEVRSLSLSSMGAWIDWIGAWDPSEVGHPPDDNTAVIDQYRHQAVMGRDQYVRVSEPGFLYPFGHRAAWITVTERKVVDRADATAFLWQREFIVVRQPVRSFTGHDSPWAQVALEPLVTPNLDPAATLTDPFVPTRGGSPYEFTLIATDRSGEVAAFAAPLVFVAFTAIDGTVQAQADAAYAGLDRIPGRGQKVALARPDSHGDTALEVNHLVFRGEVDAPGFTSRPTLTQVNAVVPAMRHLAPQAPGVELTYAPSFLTADEGGFGAANPGQLFLALPGSPPAIDFSSGSDRSGGFLAPNLMVRALSRSLGAVGDDGSTPGGLASGAFDPKTFLAGAFPRLFGLFSLVDLLDAIGIGLDDAPSFVTEALDTVGAIRSEALRLRAAAEAAVPRLDSEITNAAHDGASGVLESVKSEVAGAVTPLLAALSTLLDDLSALPGAADLEAALGVVTADLEQAADAADALLAKVGAPQVPMALRTQVERPARALSALGRAADTLTALRSLAENLLSPGTSVTARFEWRPALQSWPPPPADPVLDFRDKHGLRLAVEVRASASSPPSVDVAAEIADFGLQLLPGAPLMALSFSRIGFRVSSGGKPEVDVVFRGLEFLGPLGFVDTLRRMVPFDGFADPPYVDVSADGVVAGFDLALPNVSVGVFSLENIALGAEARVPFLGDAVTVGFHFCSKESPFRLTVMCIGGGGWVELRASPKGLVLLEVGLEAAACLSIDLGVASGSVSISVGVYLRLESDKGLLTAYFRIRGEVDVLGIISASITLELSLTYHFQTGKLIGRASLVVEIEILFFSASVEITVERKLAGSKGDPTMLDVMPPAPDGTNADWSEYCEAFAPLG